MNELFGSFLTESTKETPRKSKTNRRPDGRLFVLVSICVNPSGTLANCLPFAELVYGVVVSPLPEWSKYPQVALRPSVGLYLCTMIMSLSCTGEFASIPAKMTGSTALALSLLLGLIEVPV
jgi:hypothetical protein